MRSSLFTFILLCVFAYSQAQLKTIRIFGDHMVLQRNQAVPVWGTSAKNAKVTLNFNGQKASAKADAQGNWKIVLNAMKEGGPYIMTITSGKEKVQYSDIMMGEVWLCSGQSNMEFVLKNALGYKAEQKVAKEQTIRQFLVPKKMSLTPNKDLDGGQWLKADTNTVGDFTAVGYFFAKKLAQQLHVTVGLIHSSWGGTQAECWISKEAMLASPTLHNLAETHAPSSWDSVRAMVDHVIRDYAYKKDKIVYYNAEQLATEPSSFFTKWQKGNAPGAMEWQGRWASYRGNMFMQHNIRLDSNYAKIKSVLQLGQTDADLVMYINGKLVKQGNLSGNYQVELPPGTWKGGDNSLLIELQSLQKNPAWYGLGIYGEPNNVYTAFADTTIKLADTNWRVMPNLKKLYYYDFSPNNTVATLYNGMIKALIPYSIAGVIWYQGEANASRAYEYRTTFPLLITDWRNKWGRQFPFLFVQLSSFGSMDNSNKGSDWAELREAQTMTLQLPNTGMAVTTDIGNANDIHPKDKADVGIRLAAKALRDVYKQPGQSESPLFASVDFKDGYALVSFSHADSGLVAKDPYGYIKGFELAGADHRFYYAKAEITGNQLKVWCSQVTQPIAVRYAWTNAPVEANIFNKEGFPVGPFRSDSWKGITETK